MEAARRIDEDHVLAGLYRLDLRRARQLHRIIRLLGRALVDGKLNLLGNDAGQLLPRRRTVDVDRNHDRVVPVLGEPARQLARGGGLTGTLQTDHQQRRRRIIGEAQPGVMAAKDLDHLLVDDLDHLLARREGGEHVLAHRLFPDVANELFDDLEVHVGLEQRQADFPQRVLHVFGRELTFALQVLENPLELVAEILKHSSCHALCVGNKGAYVP